MTKLSKKIIDSEKFGQYINNLWSAFVLMNSKEDIRLLFKDLFTRTEYKMFAKRLEIARRLLGGEIYQTIQVALNVTSGTVGRVNNILSEKGDGLRKAHKSLNDLELSRLAQAKKITDNMANPFLAKIKNHQKTVLGQALKAGVLTLDKKLSTMNKKRTARKFLSE